MPGMKIEYRSKDLVPLNGSLDQFKDQFNNEKDKIRFLALLSPTCPLWRDQGARAAHENVFKNYPDADISAFIVWIPILDKDSYEAAIPSVKVLNDNRINHYYDQNKMVGKAIANSVGWGGNIAWDIYLFYDRFVEWKGTAPGPRYWMHQLTDEWATKSTYRTGDDLRRELATSTNKILS